MLKSYEAYTSQGLEFSVTVSSDFSVRKTVDLGKKIRFRIRGVGTLRKTYLLVEHTFGK